jgi:hypothetical protein
MIICGRVSSQILEDRDQELRNLVHDTQHPIDIVLNAVEDHAEFADMGCQDLTQSQTIAKGRIMLNKTRCFKKDITEWWKRRPGDAEQTWVDFKAHFHRAHQEF